jgi:hypothetical protein
MMWDSARLEDQPATEYQSVVEHDARFSAIRDLLTAFQERVIPLDPAIPESLARLKQAAVAAGDEAGAGAAWCLERIATAQDEYLRAWQLMHEDRFYAAWCALEQAELALHFLARHFDDAGGRYGLDFLRTHIRRWQSLFPYRHFLSPGFTKRIRCSICNTQLTPRHHCAHRLGDLYHGDMCCHVADDVQLLEMSLVTEPVQKYSVAFVNGAPYNYAVVHYVASGLLSPWHRWEPHRTVLRRKDPQYASVGRNEACPCGSGKKFKKCHAGDATYLMPHFEIDFIDGMRADLPVERIGESHYGVDDRT